MTIKLESILDELPDMPEFVDDIRRAPKRHFSFSKLSEQIKNMGTIPLKKGKGLLALVNL
jgi:hypothetical protein